MINPKQNDLRWSWNGDLVISHVSDLEDTGLSYDSFVQEALTRIKSDLGDWVMHENLGSSLTDLIGEPNSKKTAEEGKVRILASLTRDGFCDPGKIKIRYVPVDIYTIYYDVSISLPGLKELIRIALAFDSNEKSIIFL